jgi:hypothetical protein
MKSNVKYDTKNLVAEVSLANMLEENENEIHSEYMSECMLKDEAFVNTAGMSSSDAKYMCGMSYMKNRPMLNEMGGQLTEKQKTLPPAIQKAILKKMQKDGKINDEGKKEGESMGAWNVAQAEPTATFVQTPAAPSGNITPDSAAEGLKIDEKLKSEQEAAAPNNPGLQSATFNPNNV